MPKKLLDVDRWRRNAKIRKGSKVLLIDHETCNKYREKHGLPPYPKDTQTGRYLYSYNGKYTGGYEEDFWIAVNWDTVTPSGNTDIPFFCVIKA